MPLILTEPLIAAIRRQYRLEWEGIHGAPHWARVLRNGLELAARTQARVDVVALFAVFHDACRHNDDQDPQHGPRGAALARDFHGRHFQLDSSGLTLLTVACETHTTGTDHPDITVRTCWDADRLDLWRVGIRPHPRRLTTEAAQQPELIHAAMERSEKDDFPYRERFAVTPENMPDCDQPPSGPVVERVHGGRETDPREAGPGKLGTNSI